nr:MAG TPA: hypothetical protein [Caudoviricetes sp.]
MDFWKNFWYYKYIKNSGTALNGKRVFYFSTCSSAVTSLPIGYGLILGRLLNHN